MSKVVNLLPQRRHAMKGVLLLPSSILNLNHPILLDIFFLENSHSNQENMKNPEINICEIIEPKKYEIILKLNQTYSIFEADNCIVN
jgi:hypothetical protein